MIQEKTIFESLLDCELQTYITESKGIFYIDNGHSFDKVLFYGNEFLLFLFELKLFSLVLILSNNFLLSILVVGVVYKVSVTDCCRFCQIYDSFFGVTYFGSHLRHS